MGLAAVQNVGSGIFRSGVKPMSPALAGGCFTTEPPGKPNTSLALKVNGRKCRIREHGETTLPAQPPYLASSPPAAVSWARKPGLSASIPILPPQRGSLRMLGLTLQSQLRLHQEYVPLIYACFLHMHRGSLSFLNVLRHCLH